MKKRIIILLFIILVIASGVYVWYSEATGALDPNDNKSRIFVVRQGDSVRTIANNLKKEGLIRDSIAFFLLVKLEGTETNIQAGDFRLSPSMVAEVIAEELQHGTLDIWVTIPEGWRVEEIAQKLSQELGIPEASFLAFAEEGYMFPDTYLLPKEASASAIVQIMRKNFDKKIKEHLDGLSTKTLSASDVIIVASLVEREARFAEDRPKIASVILNRFKNKMKLDVDATVQYALGYQKDSQSWWKKELTLDDLKIKSPYNTYINNGLPPEPIANPGLASIRAVLEPAKTNFFYYLSDKKGITHYATSFEEHQINIDTYLDKEKLVL